MNFGKKEGAISLWWMLGIRTINPHHAVGEFVRYPNAGCPVGTEWLEATFASSRIMESSYVENDARLRHRSAR